MAVQWCVKIEVPFVVFFMSISEKRGASALKWLLAFAENQK